MNDMDTQFARWIQTSFEVFLDNLGILIPAALLAWLVGLVTFFILAGPLAVGMILISFALLDRQDPKPEVGDLFKGLAYFLPSFLFLLIFSVAVGLATVVLGLISQFFCIGWLLQPLFILFAYTPVMFTPFLITDKKMDVLPAVQASWDKVKTNFWVFLALNLVSLIIGSVGAIMCGIGVVISMPLYFLILAAAYRDVFATEPPVPEKS